MYRVGVFHREAVLLEVFSPQKTGQLHDQLQSHTLWDYNAASSRALLLTEL